MRNHSNGNTVRIKIQLKNSKMRGARKDEIYRHFVFIFCYFFLPSQLANGSQIGSAVEQYRFTVLWCKASVQHIYI